LSKAETSKNPAANGAPHSLQIDCNELLTVMRTILNIDWSVSLFEAKDKSPEAKLLMWKGFAPDQTQGE
jgi:hypothetical protein